ncbi:MAG: hypothetical protein IIC78_02305 [Chloroflexi bacterium]|nr:hypothetical protein [Chloroflexota bacterium]
MNIPLKLVGFEGQNLTLQTAGFFKPAKIIVGGKVASKGSKRDQYVIFDNNGFKVVVQLKQSFVDPIPKLVVDGQLIRLAKPLNALQWIWSAIPMVLIFIGGGIGGAIGAVAFWINMRVFRSEMGAFEKFVLTGMISAIAIILSLVVSTIFGLAVDSRIG